MEIFILFTIKISLRLKMIKAFPSLGQKDFKQSFFLFYRTIDKITLLDETCDTSQIPPDISKSILLALPKKPRATECELRRMNTFNMSHITRIHHNDHKNHHNTCQK